MRRLVAFDQPGKPYAELNPIASPDSPFAERCRPYLALRLGHCPGSSRADYWCADLPATLEPGKELSNVGTRVNYSISIPSSRDFLSAEGGGGSELVPSLATSWQRLDDLTLEVTLREASPFIMVRR
ncbi:hypothetical protein [Halomonas sp. PA16-9]|uniref:hypothetical protein n=1 Tax=Halomonas sp. PA16-9 TaxID=2576841 RepID=UPI0030ED3CBA